METLSIQVTGCDIFVSNSPSTGNPLSANPSFHIFRNPNKLRFLGSLTGSITDSGGNAIPVGSYMGIGLYPDAFDYKLFGFESDGTTPKALDPNKNYVDNYGFLHLQENYWDSGDKIGVVAKWIYDDSITDSGLIELIGSSGSYGGMAYNEVEQTPYIFYKPNTTATPADGDGIVSTTP